ncbi:MAG TPA: hypothetical protein VGW32_01225, partial [Pyrinomonadaceae bacterium]|nr:hypothetical protein [Pyrinomonadaceae bacterium]
RRAEVEVAREIAEEEARRLAEIQERIAAGETGRRRAEHERLRLETEVRMRAQKEQERLNETRDRIAETHKEIEEMRCRTDEEERQLESLKETLAKARQAATQRSRTAGMLREELDVVSRNQETPAARQPQTGDVVADVDDGTIDDVTDVGHVS